MTVKRVIFKLSTHFDVIRNVLFLLIYTLLIVLFSGDKECVRSTADYKANTEQKTQKTMDVSQIEDSLKDHEINILKKYFKNFP